MAYVFNLIATFVNINALKKVGINDNSLEIKTSSHISLPLSDVLNRLSQRRWGRPSFQRDIQNYHEDKSKSGIIQNKVALLPDNDYWAILDGQQCLTFLNIGLLGSYKKRPRYMRKDNLGI